MMRAMANSTLADQVLDGQHAEFIRGPVSINVAGRSTQNLPVVCRGFGCRISQDMRQVTVLLYAAQSARLRGAIADNGAIAVVFSRPTTHETIQLKGSDGRETPIAPSDHDLASAYQAAFADELISLGYDSAFARAMMLPPDSQLVAITFTPSSAFSQTPGPDAGRQLGR